MKLENAKSIENLFEEMIAKSSQKYKGYKNLGSGRSKNISYNQVSQVHCKTIIFLKC